MYSGNPSWPPPYSQGDAAYPPPGPDGSAYNQGYVPDQNAMYPPAQPMGTGYFPQAPPPSYPENPDTVQTSAPHTQARTQRTHNRRANRTSPEDPVRFAGTSFSDKAIRTRFIRKVYLIIFAQLLVTLAFICVFIFVDAVKMWVQANMWFYIVAYVVFIIMYIVLVCVKSARRSFPANYICLGIFTVAFSLMAATISSYHNTEIVLIMMAVTAGVTLLVSLFAIQTKIDFTKGYCLMIACFLSIGLFMFGLAVMVTYLVTDNNTARILHSVYGGIGALIFSFFLAIDTQLLIGKGENALSEEEYIFAALQIYVDIVYIFLMLLGASGGGGN